jgi:hypothetical protein
LRLSSLPRFAVATLAAIAIACAAVPDPASFFGHPLDADRELVEWSQVLGWFHAAAAQTDRMRVVDIGPSTEGRPLIAAFISAPENIRQLDRYRELQRRLADPRLTPPDQAGRLIDEDKVVVMITCSIHSTEPASTHSAVLLAHRLLTRDDEDTRRILARVVLILVPSLNPDGVDIVTRWYRRTLGTPWEGTSPPELYQKYTGHDNNRDWYMFTQAETRDVVSGLHNTWHPQIVYDVHQQGEYASRMFLPPWLDPIDPNIDPLIVAECNGLGAGMATDLITAGKPGVVIHALYDMWSPARHYQAYHGGLRILSESASAALATPLTVTPQQIARQALGYDPRERSWNYVQPWLGGTWRLRDIIDYQLAAMESCLGRAAEGREQFLRAFYDTGRHQTERTSPWAFVIPEQQHDPYATGVLLETLAFGGVELERSTAAFSAGDRDYAAGTWVVRMQQPYSGWAKTLLERQHYPDMREYPGGPPIRPYDVTAQTLPLLMGVRADTIEHPFDAQLEPARASMPSPPAAAVPAGVRIGLYKSEMPEVDEGWTRWLLDRFHVPYRSVRNRDVLAGGLSAQFDAILIPDQTATSISEGYRQTSMPPEFTGGLGANGADELLNFVRDGGTLVFLNRSTDYAIDTFSLPLKNVVRGIPPREFYSPGEILNATVVDDPLTSGMPEQIAIWGENSPAWETGPGARVLIRYPERDVLASGWLLGEHYLSGRAAMAEVDEGRGRIVLFGFRPQYRGQSYQTFPLLFHALARRQ